jgi:hypothetical protein
MAKAQSLNSPGTPSKAPEMRQIDLLQSQKMQQKDLKLSGQCESPQFYKSDMNHGFTDPRSRADSGRLPIGNNNNNNDYLLGLNNQFNDRLKSSHGSASKDEMRRDILKASVQSNAIIAGGGHGSYDSFSFFDKPNLQDSMAMKQQQAHHWTFTASEAEHQASKDGIARFKESIQLTEDGIMVEHRPAKNSFGQFDLKNTNILPEYAGGSPNDRKDSPRLYSAGFDLPLTTKEDGPSFNYSNIEIIHNSEGPNQSNFELGGILDLSHGSGQQAGFPAQRSRQSSLFKKENNKPTRQGEATKSSSMKTPQRNVLPPLELQSNEPILAEDHYVVRKDSRNDESIRSARKVKVVYQSASANDSGYSYGNLGSDSKGDAKFQMKEANSEYGLPYQTPNKPVNKKIFDSDKASDSTSSSKRVEVIFQDEYHPPPCSGSFFSRFFCIGWDASKEKKSLHQ